MTHQIELNLIRISWALAELLWLFFSPAQGGGLTILYNWLTFFPSLTYFRIYLFHFSKTYKHFSIWYNLVNKRYKRWIISNRGSPLEWTIWFTTELFMYLLSPKSLNYDLFKFRFDKALLSYWKIVHQEGS